jgi:hypothetical protein
MLAFLKLGRFDRLALSVAFAGLKEVLVSLFKVVKGLLQRDVGNLF